MTPELIRRKLAEHSAAAGWHPLLAVESGSRAWGFASPDSDFDVRLIYVHRREAYLAIDPPAETFELIEESWFDLGGWELRKALRLLRRSNAVLLEWLQSPLVYARDDAFCARLWALAPAYVQPAALLHHYRGIAHNSLKKIQLDVPLRLKRWFYVLRPLLAARWAVQRNALPPMTLAALLDGVAPATVGLIHELIARKAELGEGQTATLPPALQAFTVALAEAVAKLEAPRREPGPTGPLDELFRAALPC